MSRIYRELSNVKVLWYTVPATMKLLSRSYK